MTDKTVTLADAKANLSKLTDIAAQGGTIVITKHGKPVARISQPEKVRKPLDLKTFRRLTDSMPLQQEDAASLVRRLREDGRY